MEKYTPEQLNRYVDMHFDSFPKTPKVMLISGGDSLAWASRRGAGWRADCWGDWHNFSSEWSHMRDDYPQRLAAAQPQRQVLSIAGNGRPSALRSAAI